MDYKDKNQCYQQKQKSLTRRDLGMDDIVHHAWLGLCLQKMVATIY